MSYSELCGQFHSEIEHRNRFEDSAYKFMSLLLSGFEACDTETGAK